MGGGGPPRATPAHNHVVTANRSLRTFASLNRISTRRSISANTPAVTTGMSIRACQQSKNALGGTKHAFRSLGGGIWLRHRIGHHHRRRNRRRDTEARRHPHLHDTSRRAAEFRWPPRDHLRHGPFDGAVLQRADPTRSRASGGCDEIRLRPLHRDAEADRQRHHLHIQDPRRREVARRLATHRRGRGGELEPHHPSPAGYNSARANWYQMVDTVSAPDPTQWCSN